MNFLDSVRGKITTRQHKTIYFHSPCFDGLISCVLSREYLEANCGWHISELHPVNYDVRDRWLNSDVNPNCAVLDFLYHPSAGFWADHHSTTFANATVEASYEKRLLRQMPSTTLLYDPHCDSTAALLWKTFQAFFSDRNELREMVLWADKIDSARYGSVNEAMFGEHPALRINLSLIRGDAAYSEFLAMQLHKHDLKYVSELPEVTTRFEDVNKALLRGLDQLRDRIFLLEDGVVAFDVDRTDDAIVSRYAPYYFFPDARYTIGLSRYRDTVRITAMRNPWRDFESIPLGEIFKRHGGGGHQRVASVFLSGERAQSAESIADAILREMRAADAQAELREAVFA